MPRITGKNWHFFIGLYTPDPKKEKSAVKKMLQEKYNPSAKNTVREQFISEFNEKFHSNK